MFAQRWCVRCRVCSVCGVCMCARFDLTLWHGCPHRDRSTTGPETVYRAAFTDWKLDGGRVPYGIFQVPNSARLGAVMPHFVTVT